MRFSVMSRFREAFAFEVLGLKGLGFRGIGFRVSGFRGFVV